MSDEHNETLDIDKCKEIIDNANEYLALSNEVKDEKIERAMLAFRDLAVSIKQHIQEALPETDVAGGMEDKQ